MPGSAFHQARRLACTLWHGLSFAVTATKTATKNIVSSANKPAPTPTCSKSSSMSLARQALLPAFSGASSRRGRHIEPGSSRRGRHIEPGSSRRGRHIEPGSSRRGRQFLADVVVVLPTSDRTTKNHVATLTDRAAYARSRSLRRKLARPASSRRADQSGTDRHPDRTGRWEQEPNCGP
jgi:hypothetical protein